MATLTKQEIIKKRDKCQQEIFRLQAQKTTDLEQDRISIDDFNQITGRQYTIQNRLNELNVLLITTAFEKITVGDNNPGARLGAAVDQLEQAIAQLDNMRKFLDSATSVINALSGIIGILVGL